MSIIKTYVTQPTSLSLAMSIDSIEIIEGKIHFIKDAEQSLSHIIQKFNYKSYNLGSITIYISFKHLTTDLYAKIIVDIKIHDEIIANLPENELLKLYETDKDLHIFIQENLTEVIKDYNITAYFYYPINSKLIYKNSKFYIESYINSSDKTWESLRIEEFVKIEYLINNAIID